MYYEEKMIDDILHHRNTPGAEFIPFTVQELSQKVKELQDLVYYLKEAE